MEKVAAVIGGGASGVLAAIAVLRRPTSITELLIFEPAEDLGAGLAYRSNDPELLLNVAAEKMSARTDAPDGFVQFLKARFPEAFTDPHYPFVQRRYFREYLSHELAESIRMSSGRVKFKHLRSTVSDLKRSGSRWEITTNEGSKESADAVVLAMGYGPRQDLSLKSNLLDSEDPATLRKILPSEKVLIIGASLSAIDAWRVMISGARKEAQTDFLSRHGHFPIAHLAPADIKPFELPRSIAGLSPVQLLGLVRAFESSGVPLAVVADAIRPHIVKIWRGWTRKERLSFTRHLKTYWELIRHRLPNRVAVELDEEKNKGRVRIFAGRIQSTVQSNGRIRVEWLDRKTGKLIQETYDHVVNALGPTMRTSLGAITTAAQWMKLGLEQSALGFENFGAPMLWTMGPLSRARRWETIAVTEMRQEAESVARAIDEDPTSTRFASFRLHPHGAGESYLAHGIRSITMALQLRTLSRYAILHAIMPKLHRDTVSDRILNLAKKMSFARNRRVGGGG